TGYRGEMRIGLLNDIRRLDKQLLKTTVQRFVALAEDADVTKVPDVPQPEFSADAKRGEALARELGLDFGKPTVGLMPGAEYGPAKQWPAEYFGRLTKALWADGVQALIFGSEKEIALGEQVRAESGGAAINLCGKTSLVDLLDLT